MAEGAKSLKKFKKQLSDNGAGEFAVSNFLKENNFLLNSINYCH